MYGKGSVKDEYDYDENKLHDYQNAYEIEISDKQLDKLQKSIEKSIEEKPYYDLPRGSQCTVWAMDMLNSADIIDQVVKPNYNANKNGFYGILYGFFQTVIYNPYIQVDLFLLLDFINNIKNFFDPTADVTSTTPLPLTLMVMVKSQL